jgi:tetrahydromethanopterin S-methyltransferase subunit G
MTEETTNLVLEHLRRIDRKVDDLGGDMRQVILRLGSIERHLAGLNVSDVQQNSEIDRIRARLDRVERRLEITGP